MTRVLFPPSLAAKRHPLMQAAGSLGLFGAPVALVTVNTDENSVVFNVGYFFHH